VVNNPIDWSYAFNLPILVVSYGHQASAPAIFPIHQKPNVEEQNTGWNPPFRWHWLHDDQHFEPYTDATNLILENYFEQYRCGGGRSTVVTKPIIRYIDDRPQSYQIDYIRYTQMNTMTRYERKMERRPVPLPKTNGWFFENENGGWNPYQSLIQDRIEQAFQLYSTLTGPSTIDVQFPGRPEIYEINFRNGTQMNKTTSALKKIKRQ
jgi:hypothetical protein